MKKFLKSIAVVIIGLIALFVNALAFQVFWNEVILNIWQLFETTDIINTMKLSYGAFVALTIGLVLVRNGNTTEADKDEMEIIKIAIGKILTKLLYIGLTLLAVAIIF
jgi:hypothetical protein